MLWLDKISMTPLKYHQISLYRPAIGFLSEHKLEHDAFWTASVRERTSEPRGYNPGQSEGTPRTS